jgi:tRNA threonylcarbamoyl adenosine modification protein (Sua5/YciO/YrdC/YwlC family)
VTDRGAPRRETGSGESDLGKAVEALRSGAVVAIPTDTVYGLAVDPTRPGATDALFALKGRPTSVDLPVLVGSVEQAEALTAEPGFSGGTRALAERFWPGALTIVVPRRPGLTWTLGAHAATIGLRVPGHDVARGLCAEVGALATTSANLHGEPPCTDADEVERSFGSSILVVDGGRCAGAPSTVVSMLGPAPQCLREGAVSFEDVIAALGSR